MSIDVAQIVIDEMQAAARTAYPHEACGILLGQKMHVHRLILTPNKTTADPAKSFVIDPEDYFTARRDAKASGAQVMGIWHSHPGGLAEPSAEDRAQSYEVDWLWLITSVSHSDRVETKAYKAGLNDSHKFSPIVLAKL